jgi:hypothetical protein
MGGQTVPVIPCKFCSAPIDLTVDLSVDENGQAVHEDCYVTHIASLRSNAPGMMPATKFESRRPHQ